MGRLGLEGDIGGAPTGGHYPGSAHDGRPIMSEGSIRDPGGGTPRRPVSEGIGWWGWVQGGSKSGLKMQENRHFASNFTSVLEGGPNPGSQYIWPEIEQNRPKKGSKKA